MLTDVKFQGNALPLRSPQLARFPVNGSSRCGITILPVSVSPSTLAVCWSVNSWPWRSICREKLSSVPSHLTSWSVSVPRELV
jgi:hypothetical protein